MSFTIDLAGKAAIVTGSSRGLGKAMVCALAQAGADVAVTYWPGDKKDTLAEAKSVKAEIDAMGQGKAFIVELDVRKEDSIRGMVEKVVGHYGRVDILVNCAGVNIRKPAVDLTWDEWDIVLESNLKSVFFCSQAVAPYMLKQKWGRIINIGSATTIMAYPAINAYCASRGGIVQLSKSLAAEWADQGVTVNVLAPGWMRTEQTRVLWENPKWIETMAQRIPAGRIGEPDELGPPIVFLASEGSAYITGALILMDGGFTTGGMKDTGTGK